MDFPLRMARGLGALLLASLSLTAHADDRKSKPAPSLPLWQTECGSCHVAYPPRFLPARDWKEVMATLDRHYGTDASLAPASTAAILAFLERNAGGGRVAASGSPPKITTAQWFAREHREIAPAVWSRSAVRTPANCAACHPDAETGRFDEHSVRVPR